MHRLTSTRSVTSSEMLNLDIICLVCFPTSGLSSFYPLCSFHCFSYTPCSKN